MTKKEDILSLIENLKKSEDKKFLIVDGGLATELERHGHDLKDLLWSAKLLVENPQAIQQVHEEYLEAGADIIITSTYQATFPGFLKKGINKQQGEKLFQLSFELADHARKKIALKLGKQKKIFIAASIGSYGAFLANGSEFRGDYSLSIEELKDFHRERVQVLIKTGADFLAFETIPCLKEGRAIVELLKEFPETKAWISFSCKDGFHVCSGDLFSDCVKMASESDQIFAVGVNCTSPEWIESLLSSSKQYKKEKVFVVYPNSGEIYNSQTRQWEQSPSEKQLVEYVSCFGSVSLLIWLDPKVA